MAFECKQLLMYATWHGENGCCFESNFLICVDDFVALACTAKLGVENYKYKQVTETDIRLWNIFCIAGKINNLYFFTPCKDIAWAHALFFETSKVKTRNAKSFYRLDTWYWNDNKPNFETKTW